MPDDADLPGLPDSRAAHRTVHHLLYETVTDVIVILGALKGMQRPRDAPSMTHSPRVSIFDSAAHRAVIDADPVALDIALRTGVSDPRDVAFDAWSDEFEPLDLLWSMPHDDIAAVVDCIDVLVRAGATSETRAGALRELICHNAPLEVIDAFLEKTGCDPNESASFSPLASAIAHHTDPYRVAATLLNAGANPNVASHHAQVVHFITPTTALQEAIVRSDPDIVEVLLAAGADPFAPDHRTGMRAIHWARHVLAARETPAGSRILALFDALEAGRRHHALFWPDLKRELMEAAWHPARLAKHGYFKDVTT